MAASAPRPSVCSLTAFETSTPSPTGTGMAPASATSASRDSSRSRARTVSTPIPRSAWTPPHRRPDLANNADPLVAHGLAGHHRKFPVVGVEIRSADGGKPDVDDGIPGVLDAGLGQLVHANRADRIEDDAPHQRLASRKRKTSMLKVPCAAIEASRL